MSTKIIDEYVENLFREKSLDLTKKNKALEKEYFKNNSFRIPSCEQLNGLSFSENMNRFKFLVKKGTEKDLESIFTILKDFFFFSAGNDYIYRKKLEADSYHEMPIKTVIFPFILEDVHNKYNNDQEFVNDKKNARKYILNVIDDDFLISKFLYRLYCDDFYPSKEFKKKFPNSFERIKERLDDSSLTIGDYLKSLIKAKCLQMKEIFANVENSYLRAKYINKIDELELSKLLEVESLYNCDVPVCYFFDYSIYDFLNGEDSSSHKKIYTRKKKN